jgi:isopentenyl-diphosphate Delta-isomerase
MEFVDIVDKNDKVIGKDTPDNAYLNGDIIRVSLIFVFNDKNQILMQLRHKDKYHCPLHWTASAGGKVRFKENYLEGAKRELKEELGIDSELKFIGKDYYEHKKNNKWRMFLGTFTCINNGPFDYDKKEIEEIKFVSLEELKKMIEDKEKIQPEILFALKKRLKIF